MDDQELFTSDQPEIALVLAEFQQASPLGDCQFDAAYCENTRRNLWPGQSPDGRRWDALSPEGEPALPWNGARDTRVPGVDGTINDAVALGLTAFRRAEIKAEALNPDYAELATGLAAFVEWLARKRFKQALDMEAELSLQFAGEYGYCVAYVGWERELAKRNRKVTLEELLMLAAQVPEFQPLPDMLQDPSMDAESAEFLQSIYRLYVTQNMANKGFFEDELEDENYLTLHAGTAKRLVRELRENGKCEVPLPYVCKNRPLVYVARPYHEFLCARGTTDIQSAPLLFLRRTFTSAELKAKEREGWNPDWITAAQKTAGSLSMWGAGGSGCGVNGGMSAPSKMVGGVRWYALSQTQYDRIEVVYAFRRITDENGVTQIYQTIFSPHVIKGDDSEELFAKHEPLDDAHGEYPFEVYKREHLGRGLTESRSVAEISGTWQSEEKDQRDMLSNRAQWDTLPPIAVPKLGGIDYRLGPGAQVPKKASDKIEAINLNAPPPSLSLELIKLIRVGRKDYFGIPDPEIAPALTAAKQGKSANDFFAFWGKIFRKMTALEIQYNPQEVARVSGMPEVAKLDPADILEGIDVALDFDLMELDNEYLLKKMKLINDFVLSSDVTGAVDRNALTQIQMRMIDGRLARQTLMDKGASSQKVFSDVNNTVALMALGNEAQYVENDPTAEAKLQFLNQILQANPKYHELYQQDERFKALLENYAKNLKQSIEQRNNKQVGRLGVKPVGAQPMGQGQ